jgi:hypothetical protein
MATTGRGAWQVPDNSFEFRLERMFAEAPALPDAELFRVRVLEKLDRGWTARRLLIGVMGVAGGLIGAFQLVGSGGLSALSTLTSQSGEMTRHVSDEIAAFLPAGVPMNGEVLLTALVLALIAAGFGVARLVREI